jgi:hypothetical protein
MKNILTLFGLTTAITLSAPVAMAGPLETCVNAAIRGPEKRFQKVHEHEFHCKPVQSVALQGGAKKVSGQLSHHLTARPDDQVYYEFVMRNGTIVANTMKTKIKRGGTLTFIAYAGSIVGTYFGVPIPPEAAEGVLRKLSGQVIARGWEEAAEIIVSTVALKMSSQTQVAGR